MKLYCRTCRDHTNMLVLPWQTEQGKMGGISIMCQSCDTLLIASLSDLPELQITYKADVILKEQT